MKNKGRKKQARSNKQHGSEREKGIRFPPIHEPLHTRLVDLVLLAVRVEDKVVRERLVFT